jgi:hypothetical protein
MASCDDGPRLRRGRPSGDEPAAVPGQPRAGIGRRASAVVTAGLRDRTARYRARPARREGTDPQSSPAGGLAKIIDGFYPPDTERRQRLATEDPSYDPVAAYADYAWASGDRFLGETKFLIDFLDVLPTFTWIFSTSRGLPAHLYL